MLQKRPTRQVNVRLSEQDKQRLESAARRRGMRGAADLLRHIALANLTEPRSYTIVIHHADPDETGYWAEVPTLPGCFTEGETVEEVLDNAQDAIRSHLAMLLRNGEPVPVEKPGRHKTIKGLVRVDLPAA